MVESGDTYLGVATDQVIESFRNQLWPGYKTGAGMSARYGSNFIRSRRRSRPWACCLADGGAGSGRCARVRRAPRSADERVEKVAIWTPDKDLGQCVQRRARRADGSDVGESFATPPRSARSSAWIRRIFRTTSRSSASRRWLSGPPWHRREDRRARYRPPREDRELPAEGSRGQPELALLFKKLATLRTDAPLFENVDALRWRGPTPAFAEWAQRMEAPRLLERCEKAAASA